MTQCTRCQPHRPCLSHSFLPFGQTWLELGHPLLKKYPQRRIRDENGFRRDDSGRYLFSLKGLSFDECPLGWLDWLAGQDWLYEGEFRRRLFAYLKHPCIQKELDDLFPDPDDDSRKPAFIAHLQKDRWHGQIRHKEEPEPTADNEPAMTVTRAWHTIADFLNLDLDALDLGEALEQMYWIKRAIKAIPVTVKQRETVRAKYRAVRAMTRRAQLPRQEGQFYTAEQRLFELIGNAHYIS